MCYLVVISNYQKGEQRVTELVFMLDGFEGSAMFIIGERKRALFFFSL